MDPEDLRGAVVETEPCFEFTDAAAEYQASHSIEEAPVDV